MVSCVAALLMAVATYGNHFHNDFHFDDSHTIENNAYIRSLRNIPLFFTNPATFSSLPANQSYRPIVVTTLAIDYHRAGGYDPFWYHVDTFCWFLLLLGAMYLLFTRIVTPGIALLATAVFGLHPVAAETVNYIIQRGEVLSTLGVVTGLWLYVAWPGGRHFGIYFLPVAAGALSKQPALTFPAILFAYLLVIEKKSLRDAAMDCLPAGVLTVILALIHFRMTPSTYVAGGSNALQYWETQPVVILHYVKQFFLPTDLSADTDRQVATSIFSEPVVFGLVFLAVFILAVRRSMQRDEMRPAALGMLWFLIALTPTSLIPLAEVENDWRMFFPFVGLTLAVCWAIAQLLKERPRLLLTAALAVLTVSAVGTYQRNKVWVNEESLWKDVNEKSPHNGRGLMNYGLALMSRGDYAGALDHFRRAETYVPNYSILSLNEGIAYGATGDAANAEKYFTRALQLASNDSQSYFYYGRWLRQAGRVNEAAAMLHRAVELNSSAIAARDLLMDTYSDQGDAANLAGLARETLQLFPSDQAAAGFLATGPRRATTAVAASTSPQTPEGYLNLSLSYERAGQHQECIDAARQALKLRPGYAEAYNNVAAGYQSMGRWDEAIAAASEAVKLKPDFQLAKNNLQYSLNQKRLAPTAKAK